MTSCRAPMGTTDCARTVAAMQNSKCRMQTANTTHGRSTPHLHFEFCFLNFRISDPRRPDKHGHQALSCSSCPALLGADLDIEIEQIHEPPYCRGVELAEWLLAAVANFTKDRPADIDGAPALAPFDDRAAAAVRGPNHLAGNAHHQVHAQRRRRRPDDRPPEAGKFRHGPFGGVLARPAGNQSVRLAFLAQKTENGRKRSQADPAVPKPRRIQPRFVKFKAGGEQIRDALMKARDEQASDAGFNHAEEFLITYSYQLGL